MRRALLLGLGFLFSAATGNAEWQRFQFAEPHMGTMVRITTFAPDSATAEEAAQNAFARIAELNRILSDYDPESELSQLARHPPDVPVKVSPDLLHLLQRAEEISSLSDGAFDITVGAIGELWRESRRTGKLPDPAAVEQLRKTTGFRNITLDPRCQTATLHTSGMKLDLGGIAKGYAAAEMLQILRDAGLPRSLVAVSGDLAIGDPPPNREGWRVGIASVDSTEIEQTLLLRNLSVSTSGDTEQFVEIDGTRYSHILDPRTGIGLTQRISVTTIASDGATADALATAVSVLGIKKGLALIEQFPGTEALILIAAPDGKRAFPSPEFPAPPR